MEFTYIRARAMLLQSNSCTLFLMWEISEAQHTSQGMKQVKHLVQTLKTGFQENLFGVEINWDKTQRIHKLLRKEPPQKGWSGLICHSV